MKVATFDSGFGGYFTAKSIEESVPDFVNKYDAEVYITHYGDTKNAPYGKKTPEQIADLTENGIKFALENGEDIVIIACNTASTQYKIVVESLKKVYPEKSKNIFSVIDPTVEQVKKYLDRKLQNNDTANLSLFATPATVKSMIYPNKLSKLYKAELLTRPLKELSITKWDNKNIIKENIFSKSIILLPDEKKIYIYQVGPANWVDMIEKRAPLLEKRKIVKEDVKLLLSLMPKSQKINVLGFFCTHYPVYKENISNQIKSLGYSAKDIEYVVQGPIMAKLFVDKYEKELSGKTRKESLANKELNELEKKSRPIIIISGENLNETKQLAKLIFPNDPAPEIKKENFNIDLTNRINR